MSATAERVDTWEMMLIHRVFRREFRLLPELIRGVADGDRDRAEVLGEHLGDLSTALHHHHSTEDELLWPVMLGRVGLREDVVHRMEEQHGRLAALLERIDAVLPKWRAGAGVADRDELADAVTQASAALDEHLSDEENELLPLVEEYVTHAEWEALGKRGQEAMPKGSKAFVFLGAILEEATPQESAKFLGQLPAPVRVAWRLGGRRAHAKAVARVRGRD